MSETVGDNQVHLRAVMLFMSQIQDHLPIIQYLGMGVNKSFPNAEKAHYSIKEVMSKMCVYVLTFRH